MDDVLKRKDAEVRAGIRLGLWLLPLALMSAAGSPEFVGEDI